ncbi:related to tRNA nucleotidyltransferase [Melanopsichium pennsylvanicum]|uniref:Related to tRNA nucleotidyltransferase n=2 Tax=Melanopsichium pennsylvanicum TaxID=63383 RepID=A0AAJ4XRH6_9BASI|nr:related to tRNA nucleotidyltransferase [Melanopsichium pennsylvanicum 4]SNX85748.1 related to tRNA nucleotidyltransferase [Melanopsichium pennsylvanicum]
MRPDAQIILTNQEEAICQLLDETCTYIQRERPHIPEIDSTQISSDAAAIRCEARIAGGWVRDKLLSRDSDDLDISLSTLTGNAFALYLKHYLSSPTFAATSLAQSSIFNEIGGDMGRIGKIAANPEQSKNLETATARVLGLSLDFVNLRKETYSPGSRIPEMTFGTPREDAERRDITINSLLYNVHTRQVEDHTGLGLQDLKSGWIRTPLPPLTTFLDDPLRVLRCVRFASRFAYELHPTIIRCLTGASVQCVNDGDRSTMQLASSHDPRISAQGREGVESARSQIREALVSKVSRERFGIEVDKMIKGPHPLLALFLLHRLELFPLVFHPPPPAGNLHLASSPKQAGQPASDSVALNAARLLDSILKGQALEDVAPVNQSVPLGDLSLGNESAPRKSDLSRAFSSIPRSPLPKAVLESLPSDLISAWNFASLSSEERRRLWISVSLLPLRHLVCEEKKNKFAWAGESVIANGLKLGTKTLKEPVASLHKCMELLPLGRKVLCGGHNQQEVESEQLDRLLTLPPESGLSVKSRLGLLLRNPHVTNPLLQLRPEPALLICLISEIVDIWQSTASIDLEHQDIWKPAPNQTELQKLAKEYAVFWRLIKQYDLISRAEERPLLDGNAVTATLGCHPRLISQIQTFVLAWQYDQDTLGADSEEKCKDWLRGEWEKGGIVSFDQRPQPPPVKGKGGKKKEVTPQQQKDHDGADGDRRKRQKSE